VVWSVDAGVKYGGDALQAEVFVFRSDYRDKIQSVPTGATTPDGRAVVRSENVGEVRLTGLEAGLRWQFDERWHAYINANYTRGEERQPDGANTPADRIPPFSGRAGLVGELAGKSVRGLRFEAWADFAARQNRLSDRDVEDPRIDPAGSAGWMTLNALLAWTMPSNVELGLRLENLLDRRYREHASGIDAPGRNLGLWVNLPFE
jgi:outer membrane receptor protein involved in Fe transport